MLYILILLYLTKDLLKKKPTCGCLLFGSCRKDVRLPQQLQRAIAAEAEASREARAKVTVLSACIKPRKIKVF